jgi:hypothetical protein
VTRLDCRLRGNDGTGGDVASQSAASRFPEKRPLKFNWEQFEKSGSGE